MTLHLPKSTLSLLACLACVAAGEAQTPPSSILGKTDIQALFEAVPGVPGSTSEAATRTYGPAANPNNTQKLDETYRPFFQQAAAARARLKDALNARGKDLPDQATQIKQAKDKSNASPIIADMGGVDNIQRMTPEQREQAARQSVAAYQRKMVTDAGGNAGGMQALMQKMMNDPEYRARFQKMSQQEKEAEVRKFTGIAPPPASAPVDQSSQGPPADNELATSMAVRNDLQKMLAKSGEIDAEFAKKDAAIAATKGGHKEIEVETRAKIKQLPFVSRGEAGQWPDPQKEAALHDEQFNRHRERANWELQQRSGLYNERKIRYKELATEYQSWLKQNLGRINTSMATPLSGTNTELEVAGYEDKLVALSEDLATYSKKATEDAALYEKLYQDRKLHRTAEQSSRP